MGLRQGLCRLLTPKILVLVMLFMSQVNALIDPGNCDFENNFCNWRNDDLDDFDWLRGRNSQPIQSFGSACRQGRDNHCSGYNIYNDKHLPFEKGRLISPVMNQSKCMMFSYFIDATNMTSLQVFVNVNGTETLAWVRSGWRMGYWAEGYAFFNETRPYQVVVMVTSLGVLQGQTAIDDIRFTTVPCVKDNGTFYYISKNKFFKVGRSPPTDDWNMHFSFTVRKTTGNLSEPMYFVYPDTPKDPMISLNHSQSPFPVDFFYSMNDVSASDNIFITTHISSKTHGLATASYWTAYLSRIGGYTIQTFQAVLRKENPACLLNWVRLEDSCFWFNIENSQTWNDARKTCRSFHGDLIDGKSLLSLRTLPLEILFENAKKNVKWSLWYKKFQIHKEVDVRCGAFHLSKNVTEYKKCSDEKHGFICQSIPVDVARGQPVTSSSHSFMAPLAVDGIPYTCFSHGLNQIIPWMNITLPRTMFVYEVQFSFRQPFIKIFVLDNKNTRLCYDSIMDRDMYGRVTNIVRSRFICRYLTKGNVVSIRLGAVYFCQISVIAYNSRDDIKGVLRELWYDSNSEAYVQTQTSTLTSPFEIDGDYKEGFTTFMKVPMSGNYTFHLKCSYKTPCQLDLRRWDDHKSVYKGANYIWETLIPTEKSDAYNEDDICIQRTSKSLYLSKCTIYVLTVNNSIARTDRGCFSVGMTRPDGRTEDPINRKYLFSKDPGLRILEFRVLTYNLKGNDSRLLLDLQGQIRVRGPNLGLSQKKGPEYGLHYDQNEYVRPHRNTGFYLAPPSFDLDPSWWNSYTESFSEIYVELGQTIHIKVTYRNWCVSMSCPDCTMQLDLNFLNTISRIDDAVPTGSQIKTFSRYLTVKKEPGEYPIELVYSFPEDPAGFTASRKLADAVFVRTAVIQNNDFKLNSGKWTTFEASNSFGNETAELESPVLEWKPYYSEVTFCLEFDYLLSHNTTSTLKIFFKDQSGSSRLLWQVQGIRPRKSGKLPFTFTNNSKFSFVGNRTTNSTGTVTLFDVSITSKTCQFVPKYSSPDFQCGKDEFQCYSGPCISKSKRCDGDKDCMGGSDEKGCKCFTTQLACLSGGCVDSKYLCDGTNQCSDGSDEKRCGKCENRFACPDGRCLSWNSTCSNSSQKLEQCQDNSNSPTVCGNLSECPLNKLNCKEEDPQKSSYSFRGPCSFTYGFCGLTQDNTTNLAWKIGQGKTLTEGTGPSYDHTSYSAKGRYIFLETTFGTAEDSARLSSDWMNPVAPSSCLQFWYHMYGSDIGVLKIILKTRQDEQVFMLSKYGQQGNQWYLGQAELTIPKKPNTAFAKPVKFIIEGVKKSGPQGDIAVDDIAFLEGKCTKKHYNYSQTGRRGSCPPCKWTQIKKITMSYENSTFACLRFWYIIVSGRLNNIFVQISRLANRNPVNHIFDQATNMEWRYVQMPFVDLSYPLEITITSQYRMHHGKGVDVRGLSPIAMKCESIGLPRSSNEDDLVYKHLGCFKDPINSTTGNAPSLESIDPLLTGSYKKRTNALSKCAKAAYRRGFDVFALQKGGKCLASLSQDVYSKYGISNQCGSSGKGGMSANDVYVIKRTCPMNVAMCEWKKNGTQFIEKERMKKSANFAKTKSTHFPVTVQLLKGLSISSEGIFKLHKQFTMCLWVKCRHPGGFSIKFMDTAKSTPIHIKQEGCQLMFMLLDKTSSAEHCTCNGMWTHLCFTWKSFFGTWEIYTNGQLNSCGRAWNQEKVIPVLKRVTLKYIKSDLNASNSPPVSFTGLNIWKEKLPPKEILHMSYGCGGEGVSGGVISWENLKRKLPGNYLIKNHFECLFEKGLVFMNSSLSINGTSELTRWFNSSASGAKCMRFSYMMFGAGSLSLKILQKVPVTGDKVVWIDDSVAKPVWKIGEVSLGTTSKYKVTIRGQFRANSLGFIAIGSSFFTNGYCKSGEKYTEKACSMVLTNLSGEITSPLYPAYYPPGSSCTWHITVPKGNVIRLFSDFFAMNFTSRCIEDYIAIYDGPSRDHSPMIGRFCGSTFPLFESSSNTVTIVFKSSPPLKHEAGFAIKYSTRVEPPGAKTTAHCPASCRCFYVSGDKRRFVVKGKSLSIVPGNIPDDTAVLQLANNKINRLKIEAFSFKRKLEYIDLSGNGLLYIDDKAFSVLESIHTIKLNINFLRSLGQEPFHDLRSLQVLDLAENLLDKIHPDTFYTLVNLKVLSLRSNYIFDIDPKHFRGNTELQYLYLQHNKIERIQDSVFKNLHKLKVMFLNDNKIKQISQGAFRGLRSLHQLHLQHNKFAVVPETTFSDMKNLKFLEVDYFMLCCFAKRFSPSVYCDAPADEFSSCDDLMKNKAARVSIWILGILAFLGNICVVAWRLTLSEDNRVQSLLLTNLAISDFLMGVYLLIIAIKDAQWQKVYFTKDFQWRKGRLCQFTGALSMLSSEVSVIMLTVITADRFKSILYPLKFGRLTYKSALVICIIVWVFGLIISFLPTSGLEYFYDVESEMGFYGRSSVCLPLQLSTSRLAGWEYSVSLFIALNLVAFVFIFFAYLAIFITIKKSSAKSKSTNTKKEAAIAWKLMAIILTDFCCWMPVIIIGILSLTGDFYDPEGLAYVWIAVFVLPVNSSINPILYTFSNADVRKRFTKYFSSTKKELENTASTRALPLTNIQSKDSQVYTIPANVHLKEVSTVLQSDKDTNEMGYLTCWAENDSESLLLLKCFIPENHVNWIREANVLKLLNSEAENENIMSYKWHAKVKNINIETNNVEIPGMPLTPNCSVICFGFSTNFIPLIKFLQKSSESSFRVENLFAIILDVLKAVEELHTHGVSHGDVAGHNILIEDDVCCRCPPIRAILGGFERARIVRSTTRAAQAYKTDVHQVGSLIEEMLTICGYCGQFEEVSDVGEMCFQESTEWRQRITEIRSCFEKAASSDDYDGKEMETRS